MTSNAYAIAVIIQEVETLQKTINKLKSILIQFAIDDCPSESLSSLESNRQSATTFLGVFDVDGEEIHTGDTIEYSTEGKFFSKQGTVVKVSAKKRIVTSVDKGGKNIARASDNLRVVVHSGPRVGARSLASSAT